MKRFFSAMIIAMAVTAIGTIQDAEARKASSITNSVTHTVVRSDGSKVGKKERHEFRGGKHVFFPALADSKSWLSDWVGTAYKSGSSRIYLDWQVQVRKIVVHKASVGRKSFKGGYVNVEVQLPKGKWVKVFERKDDDIDKAVTIQKALRSMPPIKGVRINFKTPAPITIGPIDLRG